MTSGIEAVGWLIFVVGLVLFFTSLKARISASDAQFAKSVAKNKIKKPLSEPYRILYWRCREAVPDLVVLGAVPVRALLSAPSEKKGRKNAWMEGSLPIVILSRECIPQLVLCIVDEKSNPTELEEQIRNLHELQVPTLKLKHPYVSREELSEAIKKAEALALQRAGSGSATVVAVPNRASTV